MTKRVFKGMSGTQPYNEDVFRTVLAKAVGIMNKRPLTEITSDPNDFRALSPNDFLDPLSNDIRFGNSRGIGSISSGSDGSESMCRCSKLEKSRKSQWPTLKLEN
jgi:hypothetical protein